MDILYNEYHLNGFKDLQFTDQDLQDPDMNNIIKYVEGIKERSLRFEDIPFEYRQKLADLITRER